MYDVIKKYGCKRKIKICERIILEKAEAGGYSVEEAGCPECGDTIRLDATNVEVLGIRKGMTHCLNTDCLLYLTKEEIKEYQAEKTDLVENPTKSYIENNIKVNRNYQ